jgi:hypothetical protein
MKAHSIPEGRTQTGACVRVLGAVVCIWLAAGCEQSVEPQPTSGELIREVLVTGADESILFSTAVLTHQDGTTAFARTVDSLHRGFVNRRFDPNTAEATNATSFEADIVDTLWGSLTLNVDGKIRTFPYNKLAYGDYAMLLNNACFTCSNPWRIWRMRQRKAQLPNGSGEPSITSMTVTNSFAAYQVAPSEQVRINRDSVVTVKVDSTVHLSVRVVSNSPDDTFFVTYPYSGGYLTMPMTHNAVDSLGHTADVGVRSGRRFELLAVQGFKRQALRDTLYTQSASSAIQTAIIAFR